MASIRWGIKRAQHVTLSFIFALTLTGAPWAAAAPAVASPPTAPSAPASVGGAFVVNASSDVSEADSVLDLREALAVAKGLLTGPFSPGEQTQLGGCTFDGSGFINPGSCGGGITDTISFAVGLPLTLTLNVALGRLPSITDTAPTLINAQLNGPFTLDAANAGSGEDGLTIASDNNTITGLTIINAPRNGFLVLGNNNTLDGGAGARANGYYGIGVGGSNNTLDGVLVGVFSYSDTACSAGNAAGGVIFDTGGGNTLLNSRLGCNAVNGGVVILNSAQNVVGPANRLGSNSTFSTLLPNAIGVLLAGDSYSNTISGNFIGHNAGPGAWFTGADVHDNLLIGNQVVSNGGAGVQLDDGAYNNVINGNLVSLNLGDGVYFSGAATRNNEVTTNLIGASSDGLTARGNLGNGVVITGSAHHNDLGGDVTLFNLISGNALAGVLIGGGAHENRALANLIGTNFPVTATLPNAMGVVINTGAYSNTLGLEDDPNLDYASIVAGNTGAGVQISGSTTTGNSVYWANLGLTTLFAEAAGSPFERLSAARAATLGAPGLADPAATAVTIIFLPNGGNGLEILAGAKNTTVVGNYVDHNGGSGLLIAGGSLSTTVAGNTFANNLAYGVLLDGAQGTLVSNVTSARNGLDGLAERNGAGNAWSVLKTFENGGLGIDRAAATDQSNTITGPLAVITSTALAGVTVTVRGLAPYAAGQVTHVELYSVAGDLSGYGEGKTYLNFATVQPDGTWSLEVSAAAVDGKCLTTFYHAHVGAPIVFASEYGPNWGACRTALPLLGGPP